MTGDEWTSLTTRTVRTVQTARTGQTARTVQTAQTAHTAQTAQTAQTAHAALAARNVLAFVAATLLVAMGSLGPCASVVYAEALCTLGGRAANSLDDDWLLTEARHCFCVDQIDFLLNTDREYEAAYSVELSAAGSGLAGAFAERYITDPNEPGGICSFVLYLTDDGSNLRPPIDLYIWSDADGEPGAVRGLIPGQNAGGLPVFPFFETHPFDIVDLNQVISINGAFWVGFSVQWVEGGCSVHVGADLNGPGGEGSMVYLPEGGLEGHPGGWNAVSDVFGPTQALGIGVLYGQCPLPTFESSWGRVKALYR